MNSRHCCYILLFLLLSAPLRAVPRASLITCGQSAEYVFYLYGHTAIRIQDPDRGIDRVYNYGYFSPSQEHFISNFILGKPMYMLGVTDFESMVCDYAEQGRSLVEQDLNLSTEEAERLMEYLEWNARPENAEYRYNYFFDNCATRPRDLIEKFTGEGLIYRVDPETLPTFREATRQSSRSNRWYTFGTDLCLGVKSDRRMTVREAAFLPALLEQSLDLAVRKDSGRPIVTAKRVLLEQTQVIEDPLFDGPLVTIWGVAVLYLLLFFVVRRYSEYPWMVLRFLLYLLLGAGGVTLWFLSFISAHPHTFFNANTVLVHPFWWVLAVTMWQRVRLRRVNRGLCFLNLLLAVVYLGLGYMQHLPVGMAYLAILIGADQWIGLRLSRREKGAWQGI